MINSTLKFKQTLQILGSQMNEQKYTQKNTLYLCHGV